MPFSTGPSLLDVSASHSSTSHFSTTFQHLTLRTTRVHNSTTPQVHHTTRHATTLLDVRATQSQRNSSRYSTSLHNNSRHITTRRQLNAPHPTAPRSSTTTQIAASHFAPLLDGNSAHVKTDHKTPPHDIPRRHSFTTHNNTRRHGATIRTGPAHRRPPHNSTAAHGISYRQTSQHNSTPRRLRTPRFSTRHSSTARQATPRHVTPVHPKPLLDDATRQLASNTHHHTSLLDDTPLRFAPQQLSASLLRWHQRPHRLRILRGHIRRKADHRSQDRRSRDRRIPLKLEHQRPVLHLQFRDAQDALQRLVHLLSHLAGDRLMLERVLNLFVFLDDRARRADLRRVSAKNRRGRSCIRSGLRRRCVRLRSHEPLRTRKCDADR